MKQKILTGILAAAAMLLSACSTGNGDERAVLLEPHSLEENNPEGNNIANTADTGGWKDSEETGTGEVFSAGNESKEDGQGIPASGAGMESGQEVPASGADTETQFPAAGSLSGIYKEAYLQVINENGDKPLAYSLICLDADEIPELVIYDGEYESYSIYTVRDNEPFCMADSLVTVSLTYYEKTGILVDFARWNGGGDTGGYGRNYYQVSGDRTYTREDQLYGEQALLSYSYNAVYDKEGAYTGTGVTDYFCMGQEIDEEAFQEKLESLGIAEGEDEPCTENSYDKEEITILLSR